MTTEPSIVVIASTMRSGSTLLKALLAEADDVLNLPETNFQSSATVRRILEDHRPEQPPIKVLKKPAWYHETNAYPKLPQVEGLKTIALVRDLYDTVVSLRKMTFRWFAGWSAPWVTTWLARKYWVGVTSSLVDKSESDAGNVLLVRYEDIVADPIAETRRLYSFIGSARETGTDQYSPPSTYSWRWGSDDGSQNIKSLRVQTPRQKKRDEKRIVHLMEQTESIRQLRKKLRYQQDG
ncbi:MAG: sulfotransferase [Planctomycetota bacterium]|nr:sulfotransferase [Planctomycetota bacterium]